MINAAIQLVQSFKNSASLAWAVDRNDADLIKGFEGLRLKAYLDTAGVPTIGWGNTRYTNGKRVQLGDTITRETADLLLLAKMKDFSLEVKNLVKVALNDNQGAALLSFQYNTGGLAGSTLLRKLNAGDYTGAANEFDKWIYETKNGVKRVNNSLVTRRAQEKTLFKTPC